MIVRLWVLAWAVRYLKYVPILGWRFSETIVQKIEGRLERDVDIREVTVNLTDGAPPTDVSVEVTIRNELPIDLTVSAVNLRMGYTDAAETVANVIWSEDAHGSPPENISNPLVESDGEATLCVERYLTDDGPGDTLHVDGSLTTRAWLDVPSTKRIPLGTLQRDVSDTRVALSE